MEYPQNLRASFAVLLLLSVVIPSAHTWHLLGNTQFHCWPSSASASSSTPWTTCTGVNLRWIVAPPSSIRAQESFNVTYELTVDNSTFWNWAVSVNSGQTPPKYNVFSSTGAGANANNATAMNWCYSTTCPATASASVTNCCVHHVNVHSCPGSTTLCGPWIPASGNIFTHSVVLSGQLQQGNWTSMISGLYEVGTNYIIAHFKLADMHVALHDNIVVIARAQCGNGICEADESESCENCVRDCGQCPLTGWRLALVIVAIVLVVLTLFIVLGYLRYKSNKKFWDESWIINWSDINENVGAVGFLGSALSFASSGTGNSNNMQNNAAKRQVFTKIGDYQGKTLAIKPIKKKTFLLTLDIRKEVNEVRELDHQNLVKFVGASIEVPHVAIFTEYCPKGSLNDILLNEDVPISWSFRFSFATDVARGMAYLYQHHVPHGRLKSQNCIVDERWTVKISDYGLPTFRRNEHLDTDSEVGDEDDFKTKAARVYLAPEVEGVAWQVPSEKADVYSFGVILIEIATRNDPFGEMGIDMLPYDWKPTLPEDFGVGDASEESKCPAAPGYRNIVMQCMEKSPDERPAFNKCKSMIHAINPSKLSAVDLMMNMMEKYSKHLESIVSERTQELILEKQKTDRLLYAMLPKAVAEALKHGNNVQAESFEACTIYFSDIVGFTTISGGSTPMQVVALLNKLYTCFDSIIDKFDVYKVETIGDAYMVVSGIPTRNGHQHVHQIASMAIELVRECETFVIPHRPGEALKIRVGLHSGPCVSGVVGLKMPRYCLFGDTVNTASRMESNGEAYKIHCSSSTAELLQTKHRGFRLSKRGSIPIKGKGDMITWWLEGKEVEVKDETPASHSLLVNGGTAQRKISKISTVSNGNDSGFNERDIPDTPEEKLPGVADKIDSSVEEEPPLARAPPRLPPIKPTKTIEVKTLVNEQ